MQGRAGEVLRTFLGLGLTAFGGPVAHIGYFRRAATARLGWLSQARFAERLALCQSLPGPASSQLGLVIGAERAGLVGALAAWTGFTLPSALIMASLGLAMRRGAQGGMEPPAGLLAGLKLAAVAVVAQAALAMLRSLAPDWPRRGLAVAAAALALLAPPQVAPLAAIAAGAAVGLLVLPQREVAPEPEPSPLSRRVGAGFLAAFAVLLAGAFAAGSRADLPPALQLFAIFYRTGALVFGGGHVVLPLLHSELAPRGLISDPVILAGYGAAQAVPGPLFTYAAYLGAAIDGPLGALAALVGIFLPGGLLVLGLLPFWNAWVRSLRARAAVDGINAAVAGLVLAAVWSPGITSGVRAPLDVALALAAFAALQLARVPAWAVVLGCGAGAWALSALGLSI